jgi:hypothetical protein
MCEFSELRLPGEGFVALARAFVPESRIQRLCGDVGEAEIGELLPELDEWGLDWLQVVSPRMPPYEWRRVECSMPVELTDPERLSMPAAVTMTTWRALEEEEWALLRVIDLSRLDVEALPDGVFKSYPSLERAVLPLRLRVLPYGAFGWCSRLKSVDMAGCSRLEVVAVNAFYGCRCLTALAVPPTLRGLGDAFACSSIAVIDLSETVGEYADVTDAGLLEWLLLPRLCQLRDPVALPSLRGVTYGRSRDVFACHPTEVRFVGMAASGEYSPGLIETRVYGEVACELGRETVPFPPS